MSTVFQLPELGENVSEAEILKVLVSEGDRLEKDQPVIEVESDKATVEVPSSVEGQIAEIFVSAGDAIQVGDRVLTVAEDGEATEPSAAPDASANDAPKQTSGPTNGHARPAEPTPDDAPGGARQTEGGAGRAPVFAAPSVRRVARQLGVDLEAVEGSGPQGRIIADDVRRHAEEGRASQEVDEDAPSTRRAPEAGEAPRDEPRPESPPEAASARSEEGRREPLSRTRKTIARRMTEAWQTIPHVTLHASPDVTELSKALADYRPHAPEGVKVTLTALLLKLVVAALRRHPRANARLDADADELSIYDAVHLGVAVDTDRGLLVPVVRDADRMSVLELAQGVSDLAERARRGELSREEMTGATFTVTNLGGLGVERFTPIINPPEVAVLGVGRIGTEAGKKRLPLSLSIDHRVLDGADGARLLASITRLAEHPRRLTFEA